jgi:hypothetical protein
MTSARDLHRAYVDSIAPDDLDADCPEYGPPAPRGRGFPPNTGLEYHWLEWLDPDDRPIYTTEADIVYSLDLFDVPRQDTPPCDDEEWEWLNQC